MEEHKVESKQEALSFLLDSDKHKYIHNLHHLDCIRNSSFPELQETEQGNCTAEHYRMGNLALLSR